MIVLPMQPLPRLGCVWRRMTGRKQRGFTLIELTIVALVITVIAVLAVPRTRSLLIENRVPSVAREVLSASGTIKGSREGAGATPYVGIAIAELGAIMRPMSFTVTPAAPAAATAISHTLGIAGGAATVTIAAGNLAAAGDSFIITMGAVDRAACMKLAMMVSPDAERITITPQGGAAVTVKAVGGAFNGALAQSTCIDAGNAIAFTFQ